MELEELKSIWKSSIPDFQPKDGEEIARMLTRNSVSIIDKLKRSVWFELIFTLIVGIAFLIYALRLPAGALKWTSVSILCIYLVYTFFYIQKIMFLNRFNPASENIRGNLTVLIGTLTGYLTFYKRSYTVLYPIFFCLSLLFISIDRGTEQFLDNLLKPITLFYLLCLAGVYYFLSTRFATWYLNKLYGNHLDKLKALLNDVHG
ncbi:MAG: hypothetical protein WKF87_04575 [Chryseolinea sp.]